MNNMMDFNLFPVGNIKNIIGFNGLYIKNMNNTINVNWFNIGKR